MSTNNTMSSEKSNWQTICHQDDLINHAGVCALLENNQQIALFQIEQIALDTQLNQNNKQQNQQCIYAISNWDPIGQANVLSRGIIGDEKGEIYVASPLYKQRFSLASGQCLDDKTMNITSYQTRIIEDNVQVLVA